MAAIIYLDVDDEITSAASRIRSLDDDRIALVLPLGSRLATSRINFRLLAREGEARGKSVEIVTNDPSARALAASAGIRTYGSVAAFEAGPDGGTAAPLPPGDADAAEGEAFAAAGAVEAAAAGAAVRGPAIDDSPTVAMPVIRAPRDAGPFVARVGRPIPQRRWPWVVGAAVVGAVLAGSGLAAFLLLPSATVLLTPATQSIGPIELNVTAQVGVTEPDPINLLLPATTYTFPLEASQTFPATGTKVTETKANGRVTFSNCDINRAQKVPAGAIVKTRSGIAFRTLEEASMKKATLGFFTIECKPADANVEAVDPGDAGNVPANTITEIPDGYESNTLLVSNANPTAGGSHVETPQVQQSDVDAALATLNAALDTSFADQLANTTQIPEGTTTFDATKTRSEGTPSVDPTTLVGLEQADFELGLKAEGSIIGVDPGPVEALADSRVRTAVDDGFRLVDDSIDVEVGSPIVAGSTITFPARVRASEVRIVDTAVVLQRIRGLGLPQARTVLAEYGDARISVWPDWVTTIPTGDRATIELREPGASPSPSGGGSRSGGAPTGSASPAP